MDSPHVGEVINRVPFYWSGGYGTGIRKSADEAIEKGMIKAGDRIVLVGFGAGLTWGALTAQGTRPRRCRMPNALR